MNNNNNLSKKKKKFKLFGSNTNSTTPIFPIGNPYSDRFYYFRRPTGQFTGLPEEYRIMVQNSNISEDKIQNNPHLILQLLNFSKNYSENKININHNITYNISSTPIITRQPPIITNQPPVRGRGVVRGRGRGRVMKVPSPAPAPLRTNQYQPLPPPIPTKKENNELLHKRPIPPIVKPKPPLYGESNITCEDIKLYLGSILQKDNRNNYTDIKNITKDLYLAKDLSTNKQVCIKKMHITSINKSHIGDIIMMNECKHPNIVTVIECFITDDILWYIEEYIDGIDLTYLIDLDIISDKHRAYIIKKLLMSIQAIHNKNITCGCIKSDNIIVTQTGDVKLKLSSERYSITVVATPYWYAPELIKDEKYDKSIDIWALGILLVEMIDNMPPFMECTQMGALYNICMSPIDIKTENISDDLKHFTMQCLIKNPVDRPDIIELLNHPYITNIQEDIDFSTIINEAKKKEEEDKIFYEEEQNFYESIGEYY